MSALLLLRMLALCVLGAAFAACSTPGLRGHTHSVNGFDEPQFRAPSFAGSRRDDERGSARREGAASPYTAPVSPAERGTLAQSTSAPQQPRYDAAAAVRYRDEPETGASGGPTRVQGDDRWTQSTTSGARAQPGQPSRRPADPARTFPVARLDATVAAPKQPLTRPVSEPSRTAHGATNPEYVRTGFARWMGSSWQNHQTTTGEMFDARRLTAAHSSLPLPSFLYVTNRANGRTVLVRVNDRVPASDERVVIVSQLAAELLGFRDAGRAQVDLQYAGPAAPVPNVKHEEAFLLKQPWFHRGLLHDTRSVKPPGVIEGGGKADPGEGGKPDRYPAPTYPRWDNTRRP